jgi:hypothetical protein
VSTSSISNSEPRRLLDAARGMLRPDRFTAGLWPQGVALLTRQALESALDELWRRRAPGIAAASARAQLLCLGNYLRHPGLAEGVGYAWSGLSRACHHHAYELPPTAPELQGWIATVSEFVDAVES